MPNFDEEELTERADIEKYPTKKADLGRDKRTKGNFDVEGDKIEEFEDDFEEGQNLDVKDQSFRNPKNSTLELNPASLQPKSALNSFKLSNASQQYIKQKTYKPKKRGKKKGERRRGGGEAPSRHVLEQNPCKLGKKRQMNEKNFYEYLNGIPSLKNGVNKKKDFRDLRKLEKENLQLNEDLKDLNEKLSQMIGKKGYENLLEQLKKRKKVFVERPVSRQVKILNGELQNGEKIIDILNKERERVEKMLQKVVSPVTFSETMRKINEKKKEIKELKSQNFGLVMENKKIGKMLEKGGLGGQGILKKLLMQYNNVRAKNSEIESEIERLEGVKAELGKKKESLEEKDNKVKEKLEISGLRNWDPEVEKKFQNLEKGLKKEQQRLKIVQKNFQVKETELNSCLLYTSPSPRDLSTSRMPSSA